MRTTYVAVASVVGAAIGMPGLPARVGAATPDWKAAEQALGKSGELQDGEDGQAPLVAHRTRVRSLREQASPWGSRARPLLRVEAVDADAVARGRLWHRHGEILLRSRRQVRWQQPDEALSHDVAAGIECIDE